MLPSPSHAVIGATNLQATITYLELFGFEVQARATLPAPAAAALYGLETATEEVLLAVPGADRGWLRLVATPNPRPPMAPLDSRAFAINLFSTDLARTADLATAAGYRVSPAATHHFGPMTIGELGVRGPDDLNVTLLEQTAGRRPSILDTDPNRLHSELHAFVWSVKNPDALIPFWEETAQLEKLTDFTFDSPDMAPVLGVEGDSLRLRLIVFADAESNPARLELIEFVDQMAEEPALFPLVGGLFAPAFNVESLENARRALPGAVFEVLVGVDTVVHPGSRALVTYAPGGLRFELWDSHG